MNSKLLPLYIKKKKIHSTTHLYHQPNLQFSLYSHLVPPLSHLHHHYTSPSTTIHTSILLRFHHGSNSTPTYLIYMYLTAPPLLHICTSFFPSLAPAPPGAATSPSPPHLHSSTVRVSVGVPISLSRSIIWAFLNLLLPSWQCDWQWWPLCPIPWLGPYTVAHIVLATSNIA